MNALEVTQASFDAWNSHDSRYGRHTLTCPLRSLVEAIPGEA
jgi:hypothetical protein